uniref:Uncharacterized protein n=1 Tax=Mustela putorius furo TaxID=9669 RepID=M3YXP3_MUSPF
MRGAANLHFCCLSPDERKTNRSDSAPSILPEVFRLPRSVPTARPHGDSEHPTRASNFMLRANASEGSGSRARDLSARLTTRRSGGKRRRSSRPGKRTASPAHSGSAGEEPSRGYFTHFRSLAGVRRGAYDANRVRPGAAVASCPSSDLQGPRGRGRAGASACALIGRKRRPSPPPVFRSAAPPKPLGSPPSLGRLEAGPLRQEPCRVEAGAAPPAWPLRPAGLLR